MQLSFSQKLEKDLLQDQYDETVEQLPVPMSWFKTKPFEHQILTFAFGLKHSKTAILLDIGTGKTFCAINILRYRIEMGQVQKALIVCPLSVMSTWVEEFEKHSDLKPIMIRGNREEKIIKIAKNREFPSIYVTNYESIRIYQNLLKLQRFQMVIADESTKIKSPRTKISHSFWKLFQDTPYKLILTGLVVPNTTMDVFSQYRFLQPSVYGKNYERFRYEYGVWTGFHNYVLKCPRNLKQFKQKLYSIGISFRKEDLFDLPPKIYETREVTLSPKERKAYDSMKEDFLAELSSMEKIVATNVLTQFMRLQQITSGVLPNLDGDMIVLGNSKLKEFEGFVEENITNSKILVFVKFIHTLKKVKEWAIKKKLNPAVIYGAVPEEDRGKAISRFQNDEDCKIFIGQIAAASYGINLTKANITIFLESSFSFGDREQCEGRNYRLGQTQKVTVIDFIVPHTIDSYILKILKKKKSLADFIMQPRKLLADGERGLF